jgi:oligopeptide/dipeptide ABC transporter ATP-binding protein
VAETPLLQVRDLHVEFQGRRTVRAVRGVSYDLARGETMGLVGESGSGKSVSALSLMGLLPKRVGRITQGSVKLEGRELVGASDAELKGIRGARIGMIFQDPLSSLNPVLTIGRQITESLETHKGLTGNAAKARAVELLELVGIPNAGRRVSEYPHQFSGGMRQRAMIAMALACEPTLLIADEPTTALDVTIQAQILDLLSRLRTELGMAVLIITHDLGVVAGFADRVAVMYAGRIVETGLTEEVLDDPKHPYTVGLLRSMPRLDRVRQARLTPIEGSPPDLGGTLVGCAFAPRCAWRLEVCRTVDPPLDPVAGATLADLPNAVLHHAACHDQPTPAEVLAGRPLHATEGAADPTVTGEALEAPEGLASATDVGPGPTILEEGLLEQHVGPLPETERDQVRDAFRGPGTGMGR